MPIPLFNLVYHDCIVIPWFGAKGKKGGWGIPGCDSAYLHALLNGGTIYYSINANEDDIRFGKTALELHARIAKQEMVSHEFTGEGYRRQRTVFADGTTSKSISTAANGKLQPKLKKKRNRVNTEHERAHRTAGVY